MVYPHNYGFLKEALDYDGDELDVLVFADQAFQPGIKVPARILGAMKMIDGGETDTKLLAVIDVDPRYKHINTFKDIPLHWLAEVQDFFENYKNLQNKKSWDFRFWRWSMSSKRIWRMCCFNARAWSS